MSVLLNDFDTSKLTAIAISNIGNKIKAIRESVGYSIEDLAVTCGLANSEIVGIEEGTDSDPARLKRMAAALKVQLEDLLAAEA